MIEKPNEKLNLLMDIIFLTNNGMDLHNDPLIGLLCPLISGIEFWGTGVVK